MKNSKGLPLLALSTLSIVAVQAEEIKRPNILFLFTDDHSVEAISAYNDHLVQTPNIDRIANKGAIMLNNTVCNSICGPSRAAVLTGKHSHINGKKDNFTSFDNDQETFPKIMQESGYNTAIVGKWHLGGRPQGFDYWEITPGQGWYVNPNFYGTKGRTKYKGHNSDVTTDLALEWLEEVNPNKTEEPFLLMCQYKAPHRGWVPAPRHYNLYDETTFPLPNNFYEDLTHRPSYYVKNEMQIAHHMRMGDDLKIPGTGIADKLGRMLPNFEYWRMTIPQKKEWNAAYQKEVDHFKTNHRNWSEKELAEWKYQRYMRDYLGCVAGVDENVGRLLDYLEANGLSENTIVVYSSDQSFYLGERGWYDKRWMYHESFAMPFVISWPGKIVAGSQFDALTQNIDFAPTFLEMTDLEIPAAIQGESFAPLLMGEGEFEREAVYYHYYEKGEHNVPRHEGVSTLEYKLISFYDHNAFELYDLQADPEEVVNLYGNPDYAEIEAEMHRLLDEVKEKYEVK